jgi:hypothetical protein
MMSLWFEAIASRIAGSTRSSGSSGLVMRRHYSAPWPAASRRTAVDAVPRIIP